MPWIDIIAIVLIVIVALIGVSRGFLKTLVGLFGTLATLVLAIWLAKPVAGLINGWWGLDGTFANLVEPSVTSAFAEALPNAFGLLLTALFGAPAGGIADAAYIADVSSKLGTVMSTVVVAIGLFIVIKIIIWLLSKLFDAITKNRAISGLDRVLGFVFGLVGGIVLVAVAFAIIFVLGTYVPAVSDWFTPLFDQSPMSNWFYGIIADFVEHTLIPYFIGG